jgi:hypothetical protein
LTGNAYVIGVTDSTDFPTANAVQPTNHGGDADAFVTKINAAGNALLYSTYLGGTGRELTGGVAADAAGNAYVTGYTTSTDFPTAKAIQPTNHGGDWDAFVTKINASGSAWVYSTYLGGSGGDYGHGIAADSAGNAYVTGFTGSADFPVANAFQSNGIGCYGSLCVFVTKISGDGSTLVYSTYLHGSDLAHEGSEGYGIAVDKTGNAYVTGATDAPDFPLVNPIQPTFGGWPGDAFVTEFNAAGSALIYSTYLGGGADDAGFAIAVDSAGSAYVTGFTSSKHFPKTLAAFQQSLKGANDSFVVKIAAQSFVSVSPLKLLFGPKVVGTTTASKVALSNNGGSALTIHKIYFAGTNPGDYAETNNCAGSLASGATCDISVSFTPTALDKRQAVMVISDSDPASPQTVALSGTGTVVTLSKKYLPFGDQQVGTTSAPQSVTLTNVGSTPLSFYKISITGTNAGDFSETNTCGNNIAAGANCTITVTFTPTATGKRKALMSIYDDGGGSPQYVSLAGTGT